MHTAGEVTLRIEAQARHKRGTSEVQRRHKRGTSEAQARHKRGAYLLKGLPYCKLTGRVDLLPQTAMAHAFTTHAHTYSPCTRLTHDNDDPCPHAHSLPF